MALLEHTRAELARLLPPDARLVVAVSGGPDSQALLDLVGRLRGEVGLKAVWAAGVDHGLRPAASAELGLARALAASHGIELAILPVEVARQGNLLASARRARYAALRRFAREVGAGHLALAHTATDQVETMLMHLVRGSGLAGAGGMWARRGMLVRPLLGVTRAQIMEYVTARQLASAQDPSNADPRRLRAIMRAEVLPALRALNPALEASFARFAQQAQTDERLLAALARRALSRRRGPAQSLNVERFDRLPDATATRVLRSWLADLGVHTGHHGALAVLAMARAGHGRRSLGGELVRAQAGHLFVESRQVFTLPLRVPGRVALSHLDVVITSKLFDAEAPPELGNGRRAVAFDADHLHSELQVRSWRSGDRFCPFGMRGQVKVGDLFTNLKVPQALRTAWPVVCCGEEIAWVVGLRRAALAPVTATTRRIVNVDVHGALVRKAW